MQPAKDQDGKNPSPRQSGPSKWAWFPGHGNLNLDLVREYGPGYHEDEEGLKSTNWLLMIDLDAAERKLKRKKKEVKALYEQLGRKALARQSVGLSKVIRLKDASAYLGMDKNRFNAEVRPYLTAIPIGHQGIGFDRLDLDRWLDDYKARNGRPGRAMKGGSTWGRKSHQDSCCEGTPGILRRQSQVREFEKALAQVTLRKRKGI